MLMLRLVRRPRRSRRGLSYERDLCVLSNLLSEWWLDRAILLGHSWGGFWRRRLDATPGWWPGSFVRCG
jgi:hypothetical protein